MNGAPEVIEAILAEGHLARFTATGDSMVPSIRSGQTLLVERVEARSVRRGDVVLARMARGLTAHRVVRIERGAGDEIRFITCGDNCADEDPPLSPTELLGRIQLPFLRNLVNITLASARRWVRRLRQ